MAVPTCPICKEPAPKLVATDAGPEKNTSFPFCSSRCRLLDLGNWLDGAYAVPGPAAPIDSDPEPD